MKKIFLIVWFLLLSAFPALATNITWSDKVADDGIEPVDATEAFTHEDANAIKAAVNSKQDASANLTEWSNTNPSENGKSFVAADDYSAMRTLLDVPLTAATLVGSCTVGPCLDGTSDGGDLIKLYGPSGFWTAIQAGNATANRSWRVPLIAPPGAGEVHTMTMDENGQMAFWNLLAVINAGAPNGTGTKVDWSQLANVPAGFADGTDDGGGTDDQTAAEVPFTPNGSIEATDVQAAIQEVRDEAGAGGAPTDAHYLTTTAESGLSAEANLGALTTGLLKITINTGVATPSTAVAGTDYVTPSGNITGTAGGLSGTPNITVGTISAGATGFSVDPDGDTTAKTVTAGEYLTNAVDGNRWAAAINTVAITADATLGRIAWLTDRYWLANGTNWTTRYLLDSSFIGSAVQAYDADIADLADGSLTASKVAGSAVATGSKATTYTIGTDSANESYGGTIYVTSATTITAPAVAAGMNFTVVTIGDIAVSLDVNAADKMILDGVTLADGDKATNTSKAGDTITCQYYSADGWYCWSGTVLGGHWTDGN